MDSATKRDGYINLLSDLNSSSDICWALRRKNFPKFCHNEHRSPAELTASVLQSDVLARTIARIASSRKCDVRVVELEAQGIAGQMAHAFQLRSVRGLAFVMTKVFQRLWSAMYVNQEVLHEIKELCASYPIVFMPTHRSYMDFVILSFLCFHYEIPLPAIASAMDFMGMRGVGEILRQCGAFFIRRANEDSDVLYWTIFSEYIQTHIRNGDRPVEFFIEGTRSRTGKSLYPKIGLLSVLLESFLKGAAFDIMLVPVSISYSKILEEVLYAYELLGFHKPRESTSGLVKARSVLNMDFGEVYVTFERPVSVRHYFEQAHHYASVQRADYAFRPLACFAMSARHASIRSLALSVSQSQQNNLIVNVWHLCCVSILCLRGQWLGTGARILLTQITQTVRNFMNLSEAFGHHVWFRSAQCCLEDDLHYWMQLHCNLIEYNDFSDEVLIVPTKTSAPSSHIAVQTFPDDAVAEAAVPWLVIANYANHCSHWLSRASYFAAAVIAAKGRASVTQMQAQFQFLQELFAREFVCDGGEHSSFRAVSANIVRLGAVAISDVITVTNEHTMRLLAAVLRPFLIAYALMAATTLNAEEQHGNTEKLLIRRAQAMAVAHFSHAGSTVLYEVLSSDTLKNALHTFVDHDVVEKLRSTDKATVTFRARQVGLSVCLGRINHLAGGLDLRSDCPKL